MTLAQYLRLLRTHWLLVAILTISGTAGAATFAYLQTPQYTAMSELFVSTSAGSNDISSMAQAGTFSQQRVKSYTSLVTGPSVLEPVIKDLSLPLTADDLAFQVSATSPLDTVLIQVAVTDPSPQRAADIAESIALHFPKVVRALETGPSTSPSSVTATITRHATVPLEPVSPRIWLDIALGLLVGLGLGVGVAVLRDSLDRSVSTKAQAAEAAGAPVLAMVGDDATTAKTPLIVHDPFSVRAEAFRQLRTNIRFLSVDHQLHSLVVTGSVPSEGKSTTAANLAIAMAQSGEPVVLIDADLRRPTLADVFGLPGGIGLTTVLIGDAEVGGALQPWRPDLPLQILTAGPVPPNPSELIGSARMAEVVQHLTAAGLTVVIDSPPLLPVTDAAILARVTDGALVVTRAGSTHVEQLTAAAESLRAAGATVLGVVMNRVPKNGRAGYGGGYGSYGGPGKGYAPHATSAAAPAPAQLQAPMPGAQRSTENRGVPTSPPTGVVFAPPSAPGGFQPNDGRTNAFQPGEFQPSEFHLPTPAFAPPTPAPVPVGAWPAAAAAPVLAPALAPASAVLAPAPVLAPDTDSVQLTGVAGLLDLSSADAGQPGTSRRSRSNARTDNGSARHWNR